VITVSRPDLELRWMTDGFQYLVRQLSEIDDVALGEPSALPVWTRKHVVSHLGFNVRAIGRLVHWARTGEVTPMYPNTSAREEEIAEGARWEAQRLREFVHTEQEALAAALWALNDSDWSSQVITGRGRTVDATELPWMRTREVWIHAVDLNVGGGFTDFPRAMIDRLIVDVVTRRRAGEEPTLDVRPTDRNLSGLTHIFDSPTQIEGTATDLARWLTRRETRGVRTSDGTPLPDLGPWL
jgi:maleylpyruvate isomerase